jgi:hypothetical protein
MMMIVLEWIARILRRMPGDFAPGEGSAGTVALPVTRGGKGGLAQLALPRYPLGGSG